MIVFNIIEILKKFGSVSEYLRKRKIKESVWNGLQKKTTLVFQKGSESFEAFKIIDEDGFVIGFNKKEKEIA